MFLVFFLDLCMCTLCRNVGEGVLVWLRFGGRPSFRGTLLQARTLDECFRGWAGVERRGWKVPGGSIVGKEPVL